MAPLKDKSRTSTVQIRASYFLTAPLADMACTSVAAWRTSHELVLSNFVSLILEKGRNGVRVM